MLAIFGLIIGIIGLLGAVSAGVVIIRSSADKTTLETWKGEAEAQKAKADRLEVTVNELLERVRKLEQANETLTALVNGHADIAALTEIVRANHSALMEAVQDLKG